MGKMTRFLCFFFSLRHKDIKQYSTIKDDGDGDDEESDSEGEEEEVDPEISTKWKEHYYMSKFKKSFKDKVFDSGLNKTSY